MNGIGRLALAACGKHLVPEKPGSHASLREPSRDPCDGMRPAELHARRSCC